MVMPCLNKDDGKRSSVVSPSSASPTSSYDVMSAPTIPLDEITSRKASNAVPEQIWVSAKRSSFSSLLSPINGEWIQEENPEVVSSSHLALQFVRYSRELTQHILSLFLSFS